MNESANIVVEKRVKFKKLPTIEYLNECFDYNHETGVLVWKQRPIDHFPSKRAMHAWRARWPGRSAGTVNTFGHMAVGLQRECGQQVLVHRLIWIMFNGPIPDGYQIDHIDGNPSNNKLGNLRLATNRQNAVNCKRKTGKKFSRNLRGTYPKGTKWQSGITVHGRHVYLGTFNTPEEAHEAYKKAHIEAAGEFANKEVTT